MILLVFGLGHAGASLIKTIDILIKKYLKQDAEYVFVVRKPKKASLFLRKSPDIIERSVFLPLDDFRRIPAVVQEIRNDIKKVDICINASIPQWNDIIMRSAIELSASYCDLASDIYNVETISSLEFKQNRYHNDFKGISKFALINAGVSPGITNLLISDLVHNVTKSYDCQVDKIDIYLLEEILSEVPIFSWSYETALQELTYKPIAYKEKEWVKFEPFSSSTLHYFENIGVKILYPIYQEEILALHNLYEYIPNIFMYAGGTELEEYKLSILHHLGTFNKMEMYNLEGINKSFFGSHYYGPESVESMLKNGIIKAATFVADINVFVNSTKYLSADQKNKKTCYSISIEFKNYLELIDSIFADTTYIGYITGVCAAVLLLFTYIANMNNDKNISGVIGPEQLCMLDETIVSNVKLELARFMIELREKISIYDNNK